MKKFDYKTVTIGLADCLDLNQLGNEGWEMCGAVHFEYKIIYYFKREVNPICQE